jgi:thymidylate synthase (FAD)
MSELQPNLDKQNYKPEAQLEIIPQSVKFVSETQSPDKNQTPEQLVGYLARVSNPKNQDNPNVVGLLKYCIKQEHWSVFAMVDMTLEIVTSRAIAPQILRHKSFDFQEFSQRYSQVSQFQGLDVRLQDTKNRQASVENNDKQLEFWLKSEYERLLYISIGIYQEALRQGVAKEVARMLLPQSASTKLYMKGSLRSWIHYIELRSKDETQKEHREIANMAKTIFIERYPTIAEALSWTV